MAVTMHALKVFHTQEYRTPELRFPVFAEGNEQWLGDGFYFWQDEAFAKWWGQSMKCKGNPSRQFSIFSATLNFTDDDFIDTVFNETDYYNFVMTVEEFAKKFAKKFKRKPSLEEFNDFISDFNIWDEIKVFRYQDLPPNNTLVEVNNYYYRKRIQIRVNDPAIISNFAHLKTLGCV